LLRALIAVVDDDESVRNATKLLVESFGYRATAFESAEAYLGSWQQHDAACIIADMHMPGMNGLELQARLAAAGCRAPIIFISADDAEDPRRRAIEAGAVAFLPKPYSDQRLLETIQAALLHDNDVHLG
jgi:FixJ family two-component response regulator